MQNFHERLSEWVSSQGFWFQLRYSFSGGGAKGALGYHLFRLFARLLVFTAVAAAGTWVFLVKQSGSASYSDQVKETLVEKLRAEEIQLQGLSRQQGEFYVSRLAMSGGDETFFTVMEARNLKCQMGLLDGFRKQWDPGPLTISRLDMGLRAGADSAKAAASLGDVLFQDLGKMKLDAIVVNDTSLRWGYSERTRGSILGSKMRAQKLADGWRLRFRGGTFTQNWLKRLEIVELDVVFRRQGIVFEKAVLRKNQGYVTFTDLKVTAGERPEVTGNMNLRKIDVAALVPIGVRNFLEGTVSGQFKVFGSTNSADGVGFEGEVMLAGDDVIFLRDRIHLLRALSVVDAFNNYRRVDFRDGSFRMKTHGGRMELSQVDIRAGDLLQMKGEMVVRLPTAEEALQFNETGIADDDDGILNDDEIDITLERAAMNAGESVGFRKEGDDTLFERLGLTLENRRLEEKAAERLARSYRYEGMFTISLPRDSFVRAPQLQQMYPGNGANGRVVMDVPIEGVLYDLTLKQANEIYEKGAR
ncbi:hypothetical protein HZ994_02695 [Akkermansiaceae bacterium]|nr:hypothetical protein HZ994_02695 [Akkermansiaceae bacterium]